MLSLKLKSKSYIILIKQGKGILLPKGPFLKISQKNLSHVMILKHGRETGCQGD